MRAVLLVLVGCVEVVDPVVDTAAPGPPLVLTAPDPIAVRCVGDVLGAGAIAWAEVANATAEEVLFYVPESGQEPADGLALMTTGDGRLAPGQAGQIRLLVTIGCDVPVGEYGADVPVVARDAWSETEQWLPVVVRVLPREMAAVP